MAMKIEFETVEEFAELVQYLGSIAYVEDDKKRPQTGAERTRKCREKKKLEAESVTKCDDNSVYCNEIETISNENNDKRNENEADNVTSAFNNNIKNTNNNLNNPENKNNNIQENVVKVNNLNINAPKQEKVENVTKCNENVTKNKTVNNQQNQETVKSPDDDSYWNVFGKKKELAIAFYREAKFAPKKNEFGRWQKDLDQFIEAGITVDIMVQAIRQLYQAGLTIKAPGSVFATARSLMLQPQVQKPVLAKAQTWREAGEEIMAELNADNDMYSMFALPSEKQYEVIDL